MYPANHSGIIPDACVPLDWANHLPYFTECVPITEPLWCDAYDGPAAVQFVLAAWCNYIFAQLMDCDVPQRSHWPPLSVVIDHEIRRLAADGCPWGYQLSRCAEDTPYFWVPELLIYPLQCILPACRSVMALSYASFRMACGAFQDHYANDCRVQCRNAMAWPPSIPDFRMWEPHPRATHPMPPEPEWSQDVRRVCPDSVNLRRSRADRSPEENERDRYVSRRRAPERASGVEESGGETSDAAPPDYNEDGCTPPPRVYMPYPRDEPPPRYGDPELRHWPRVGGGRRDVSSSSRHVVHRRGSEDRGRDHDRGRTSSRGRSPFAQRRPGSAPRGVPGHDLHMCIPPDVSRRIERELVGHGADLADYRLKRYTYWEERRNRFGQDGLRWTWEASPAMNLPTNHAACAKYSFADFDTLPSTAAPNLLADLRDEFVTNLHWPGVTFD